MVVRRSNVHMQPPDRTAIPRAQPQLPMETLQHYLTGRDIAIYAGTVVLPVSSSSLRLLHTLLTHAPLPIVTKEEALKTISVPWSICFHACMKGTLVRFQVYIPKPFSLRTRPEAAGAWTGRQTHTVARAKQLTGGPGSPKSKSIPQAKHMHCTTSTYTRNPSILHTAQCDRDLYSLGRLAQDNLQGSCTSHPVST